MGTRADFYIASEDQLHWIGSVAWDGGDMGEEITEAKGEQAFRRAVTAELEGRNDATFPEQGWPWPWKDSNTTDWAYVFRNGRVLRSKYGDPVCEGQPKETFPDMTAIQAVTLGERSGVMLFATGD